MPTELDTLKELFIQTKADALRELMDARIHGIEEVIATLERMFNMRVESLKTAFGSNIETLNARMGTMDACATKAEVGASLTGQEARLRSLEERIGLHVRGDEYRRGQDAVADRLSKIENKQAETHGSARVANAIWATIGLVLVGLLVVVLTPIFTK